MLDNNQADLVRFSVPAGATAIASAIAIARTFGDRCPDDQAERVVIIVEEAIANIVEHGDCPPGSVIEGIFAMHGSDVILTLSDPGKMFDPVSVMPSAMISDRGGGAGIAFMRAWSRSIEWEWRGGRNWLRITIGMTSDYKLP